MGILYCMQHNKIVLYKCKVIFERIKQIKQVVGSLKMNTTLEYSIRVVQEGGRRCKKSTLSLNDLAYLTPLIIPLINPVKD
jgi:hypothetical protein